jgi:hypothetical protein
MIDDQYVDTVNVNDLVEKPCHKYWQSWTLTRCTYQPRTYR